VDACCQLGVIGTAESREARRLDLPVRIALAKLAQGDAERGDGHADVERELSVDRALHLLSQELSHDVEQLDGVGAIV
jgi:hypothetical protein